MDEPAWRQLYPFASHFATRGSVRQHYLDEGAGPPIVCVHGNPTWSFYWRRLVAELRGNYRVVAVDHIGMGLSDKPPDYPYRLATHIDNLAALLDQLDLTGATLVVHDWGGAIGLGAALRAAHRVARLVLLNTGAFPPPYVPRRIALCRTPLLGTLAMRGLNTFARAALTMAVARGKRLDAATRADLLAQYDSWAHRVGVDRFVKDIPFTPRHPTWRTLAEIEAGLPSLADRPVRIVWGGQDWCFNQVCLTRLQQAFPQAETTVLPDAGHYLMEDSADEVVSLVRAFLSRTAGGVPTKN